MLHIQVPEILKAHKQLSTEDLSFVYYNEHAPAGRHLISFNQYAVSFILSGQKELYRGAECQTFNERDAVLIPRGNAVIAERKLKTEKYSSLVIFFAPKLAEDFLSQYISKQNKTEYGTPNGSTESFLQFRQTPYCNEYTNALIHLIEMQVPVQPILLYHKLEELFLIMLETCPAQFFKIFSSSGGNDDNKLRQVVENNLLNNLTLTELAFLSNRSLAKFKRDFEKEYHISPGKYIRERKLDIAKHSINEGQPVNNISALLGYDNISNFISAFKKKFGQIPQGYRSRLEI